MRAILGQRPLRFVFAANVISMLGSGMNSAAVAWYILEATHSEMALGTFAVLQTVPAMLMLPFTGVLIDREDRRVLVMWLDAVRAVIIVTVAILAFRHRVQLWQLYLMNTLVAAGFWMFWPTITALIQELTPEGQFVQSNTFLLAGVQGGWLIAGSIVGFMYNHIGLGGVLLIDVSTYVVSFLCYFGVRKGRHVVLRPEELRADLLAAENQFAALLARDARRPALSARPSRGRAARHQLGVVSRRHDHRSSRHAVAERARFPRRRRRLRMAQRRMGHRRISQRLVRSRRHRQPRRTPIGGVLHGAAGCVRGVRSSLALVRVAPFCCTRLMGSARGVGGIAMNTSLMEMVPQHLMGRVQNAFYFFGTFLQLVLALAVGAVAHKVSLVAAFAILACVYGLAFVAASWPVGTASSSGSHCSGMKSNHHKRVHIIATSSRQRAFCFARGGISASTIAERQPETRRWPTPALW